MTNSCPLVLVILASDVLVVLLTVVEEIGID